MGAEMVAFLESVLSGLDCLDCLAEKGGKRPESKRQSCKHLSCEALRSEKGEREGKCCGRWGSAYQVTCRHCLQSTCKVFSGIALWTPPSPNYPVSWAGAVPLRH